MNADFKGRAGRQEKVKGAGKAGEEDPGWQKEPRAGFRREEQLWPKGSEPHQLGQAASVFRSVNLESY